MTNCNNMWSIILYRWQSNWINFVIQIYIKYQLQNNFIYLSMTTQNAQFTDIFKKNYGKRNFNKYFTERKKKNHDAQILNAQNQQFLQSVSRTSSIRVNQKHLHNPKQKKNSMPFSFQLIKNEADQFSKANQFLQNIIKNQINNHKKDKNVYSSSSRSKRYKQKNQSEKAQKIDAVIKIYKSNNYVQFSAYSNQKSKGQLFSNKNSQASYMQVQKIRKQHSMFLNKNCKIDLSQKTSEDKTFFKPQQNPKRQIIFRKSFSQIDKRVLYSVQISVLKNRIIIFYDAVGIKMQKKFRLIMNPQDTRIFNNKWKHKVQQFTQKCLKIDIQNGIYLNHPIFMQNQNVSSRILNKQKLQMIYSSRKTQNFIKIGSIGLTQQYSIKKQNKIFKQVDSKQAKRQNQQDSQQKKENPQTIINKANNISNNLSEIVQEQSKQIASQIIKPQESEANNNSRIQISQNFQNSQILTANKSAKLEQLKDINNKSQILSISNKFQQLKVISENGDEKDNQQSLKK